MDLYYRCSRCSGEIIWKVKVHGTRPMARTMIGDVICPDCGHIMVETGMESLCNLQEFRGKPVAARQ